MKRSYASVRGEWEEDDRKAKEIADAKAREERACIVCGDMDHTTHLRCCYKGCKYHSCATCTLKFGKLGDALESTLIKCMLCKEYYQSYATPNTIREMLESHDNFQVKTGNKMLAKAGEEIMIAQVKSVASSVVTSVARPQEQRSLFGSSQGGSSQTGLFEDSHRSLFGSSPGGLFGNSPSLFYHHPQLFNGPNNLFA